MTRTALALIVDDEKDICELLAISLQKLSIDTRVANDLKVAKALLESHQFDLCLTDMRLSDGDGLELIHYIKARQPRLPVAVLTAYGNMSMAISSLKAGAFDFVCKPIELQALRNLVTTGLQLATQAPVSATIQERLTGRSSAIKKLHEHIIKVAAKQAPVYISGEPGTGKKLVAHIIHEQSSQREHALVTVNCGAIPVEAVEAEFFGYQKKGFFQQANGGTLFLDDIADLPLAMQAKLLKVLEDKSFIPLGTQESMPLNLRLITATHKNLKYLVEQELFRQDLYYKINVLNVYVPTLAERIEDIPLLAEALLKNLTRHSHLKTAKISPGAIQTLQAYHYPGNICELENILERALAFCENGVIQSCDLQLQLSEPQSKEELNDDLPLEEYLTTIEKERILQALGKNNWNRTATAKDLGMTFRSLRYRLAKLNIDKEA